MSDRMVGSKMALTQSEKERLYLGKGSVRVRPRVRCDVLQAETCPQNAVEERLLDGRCKRMERERKQLLARLNSDQHLVKLRYTHSSDVTLTQPGFRYKSNGEIKASRKDSSTTNVAQVMKELDKEREKNMRSIHQMSPSASCATSSSTVHKYGSTKEVSSIPTDMDAEIRKLEKAVHDIRHNKEVHDIGERVAQVKSSLVFLRAHSHDIAPSTTTYTSAYGDAFKLRELALRRRSKDIPIHVKTKCEACEFKFMRHGDGKSVHDVEKSLQKPSVKWSTAPRGTYVKSLETPRRASHPGVFYSRHPSCTHTIKSSRQEIDSKRTKENFSSETNKSPSREGARTSCQNHNETGEKLKQSERPASSMPMIGLPKKTEPKLMGTKSVPAGPVPPGTPNKSRTTRTPQSRGKNRDNSKKQTTQETKNKRKKQEKNAKECQPEVEHEVLVETLWASHDLDVATPQNVPSTGGDISRASMEANCSPCCHDHGTQILKIEHSEDENDSEIQEEKDRFPKDETEFHSNTECPCKEKVSDIQENGIQAIQHSSDHRPSHRKMSEVVRGWDNLSDSVTNLKNMANMERRMSQAKLDVFLKKIPKPRGSILRWRDSHGVINSPEQDSSSKHKGAVRYESLHVLEDDLSTTTTWRHYEHSGRPDSGASMSARKKPDPNSPEELSKCRYLRIYSSSKFKTPDSKHPTQVP